MYPRPICRICAPRNFNRSNSISNGFRVSLQRAVRLFCYIVDAFVSGHQAHFCFLAQVEGVVDCRLARLLGPGFQTAIVFSPLCSSRTSMFLKADLMSTMTVVRASRRRRRCKDVVGCWSYPVISLVRDIV